MNKEKATTLIRARESLDYIDKALNNYNALVESLTDILGIKSKLIQNPLEDSIKLARANALLIRISKEKENAT